MERHNAAPVSHNLIAVVVLGLAAASPVAAEPVKLEAVISPRAESRLEFADGSKRFVLAVQREGKVVGDGPLAGATMLEWGFHDVTPGAGANANGYLVFTTIEGDIAYFKYQFRMIQVPGPEGKPQILINGNWEVVGGTGKLKSMRGAGMLQVKVVSPKERQWILEGELI